MGLISSPPLESSSMVLPVSHVGLKALGLGYVLESRSLKVWPSVEGLEDLGSTKWIEALY